MVGETENYLFVVDKFSNSKSLSFIQFSALKLHPGKVLINGMMNSIKVVDHSKTHIVKVVHDQ